MKRIKLLIPVLSLSALPVSTLTLVDCGCSNGGDEPMPPGPEPEDIKVQSITINGSSSIDVKSGGTSYSAIVKPENATNKKIEWLVEDTSVAIIDLKTGYLTPKSKGNTNVIARATDGSGIEQKFPIEVTETQTHIGYVLYNGEKYYFDDLEESCLCSDDNEDIIVGGQSFYRKGFDAPIVFLDNTVTSIGDNFLNGCTDFSEMITFPNSLVSIGNNFLYGCSDFNEQCNFSNTSLKNIGNNFLYDCSSFNMRCDFSNTSLENIGNFFMYGCENFRMLEDTKPIFPNTLKTIGDSFLCNLCKTETHSINVPDLDLSTTSLESIGSSFLSNSVLWDASVILPDTTKIINNGFMFGCTGIGSVTCNGVQEIGNKFMAYSSFSKALSLLNVKKIGDDFMRECQNFETLELSSSIISIGNNFLSNCDKFNCPLTFSNTLNHVGTDFLFDANNMCSDINLTNATINSVFEESDQTLAMLSNTGPLYSTGINIIGDNAEAFRTLFPNSQVSPYRNLH